jgi:hypothetical protein
MSDEINARIPPRGTPPRKTNWRPIGLTILSAFLLAATSCFGAINSVGNTASEIFSVAFVLSVLALVGGLIWALAARINSD